MTFQGELSNSHLVIIPSYNTGELLQLTVKEVLQYWQPVWVVIDGSDDGSDVPLASLQEQYAEGFRMIKLTHNVGKGAALLEAMLQARDKGFTHVLTMDADYQHPAEFITQYMQTSLLNPQAMVLGEPLFDDSAPLIRVKGRRISNWWANLETWGWGIHDSLFGMRIYPLQDLIAVMQSTYWARRFDFDPEVAVRMAWRAVPVINLVTPVRYISIEDGGVSQFKYGRDNILLIGMHIRLFFGFLLRLPKLVWREYSKTRR